MLLSSLEGRGMSLALRGQRPWMLLKIPKCVTQALMNNVWPQISIVLRLRNLAIEDTVAMDIVNIVPDDAGICVNVDIDMDRHGHRHS